MFRPGLSSVGQCDVGSLIRGRGDHPRALLTSYSDIVRLAGGRPVVLPLPCGAGVRLTPTQLQAAITPATRWVMLNAPSNPSGAIYSSEEQRALADVLVRHPHVLVLVDEIYQHLSYVPFTSFRVAAPELAGRMLIVNGVSKAYSMTGWRIGWGIAPEAMIRAMGRCRDRLRFGRVLDLQAAALAAPTGINRCWSNAARF
ncbi:MAG: aminotransferase class I/II-fold pyridoxal phosphate-dependent enzyme [Thalassovita sp.]